jgi:hypothetical protein
MTARCRGDIAGLVRAGVTATVATVVVAALVGACSSDSGLDRVLVSRDDRRWTGDCANGLCHIEVAGQTFQDERGAEAMVARALMTLHLEPIKESPVECGDVVIQRPSLESSRNRNETDNGVLMTFDDPGAMLLIPESSIYVPHRCYDEVGRWEGLDGSYSGRTGTYRLVDDSLQVELTLTDS